MPTIGPDSVGAEGLSPPASSGSGEAWLAITSVMVRKWVRKSLEKKLFPRENTSRG